MKFIMRDLYSFAAVDYNGKGCNIGTTMFSGIAESEKEFREMCEANGFDLTGLEIERGSKNPKDEMGRSFPKKVQTDLGIV